MTSSQLGWLEFNGAELTGGPPGGVPLSPPGPGGGVVLVTWELAEGQGLCIRDLAP